MKEETSLTYQGRDILLEKLKKLVIFDFDLTLTAEHLHNFALSKNFVPFADGPGLVVNGKCRGDIKPCKSYQPEKIIEAIENNFDLDKLLPHKSMFSNIIKTLLKAGTKVAIASYNEFPVIVDWGLEKMDLTKEEIAQIDIICGMVPYNSQIGKKLHIEAAKELTGVTDKILLVDDGIHNCRLAQIDSHIDTLVFDKRIEPETLRKAIARAAGLPTHFVETSDTSEETEYMDSYGSEEATTSEESSDDAALGGAMVCCTAEDHVKEDHEIKISSIIADELPAAIEALGISDNSENTKYWYEGTASSEDI